MESINLENVSTDVLVYEIVRRHYACAVMILCEQDENETISVQHHFGGNTIIALAEIELMKCEIIEKHQNQIVKGTSKTTRILRENVQPLEDYL